MRICIDKVQDQTPVNSNAEITHIMFDEPLKVKNLDQYYEISHKEYF